VEFTGRAALVTGAGSGIGRAISLSLAAGDAFVWVSDFDENAAAGTVHLIENAGGRAEAIGLDVRSEPQWEAAFSRCDEAIERLTTLVNCAGKAATGDTFSMSLERFRDIMAINAEGTFLGMKHGIPRISGSGGGAVINISSLAGLRGIAGMTAYSGSKGAIRMMTKSVALECAGLYNGVRVNSVHPGVVDTPAWRAILADVDPEVRARDRVPIGVACTPAEVADTVYFLASDSARHITGTEIVIDGGMTAG